MNSNQLQEFTKDSSHWGENTLFVLNQFMLYLDQCQDPIHIYKYMEEKSICTFMPQYWLKKADYYYDIGEYQNCFLCLEEAEFRQDDEQQSNIHEQIDFKLKIEEFKGRMQSQMKKFPLRGKRTVQQFIVLSKEKGSQREQENKQQRLMSIYKNKYGPLKSQHKKMALKSRELLPKSWMFEIYNGLQEKDKLVESKLNDECKLMETPNMRSRASKKISKTVDSVQLLKKKNTIQKSLKIMVRQEDNKEEQKESKRIDDNYFGPQTQIKKKVTFDTTYTKINQVKSNIDRPKIIKFSSITIPNNPGKGAEKQLPFRQNDE